MMARELGMSMARISTDLLCGLVCVMVGAPAAFAVEAESSRDAQLDEIVVTANKRAESINNVPSTVNAVSGAQLEQLHASSFEDFANFVPSMSSASAGIGENQIVLRGISTGNLPSSSVAIYLDETPVGSSTSFAFGSNALDSSVFDLQRLEVLSGPQGTLYGASTLGGLVKYVTRPPDLESYEEIIEGDLSHTQNGDGLNHSERAAFNLPIIKDVLAVRIDGFAQNDAGYVDNPGRDLEGVNAAEVRGGRISALGQITPDLSLRLTAMTQRIDRNGKSEVDRDALTQQPVQGLYDTSTLANEPYSQTFLLYSGLLSWNAGWANLTSNTAWQKIGSRDTIDTTRTFGPILGTGLTEPFTTYNAGETRKFTEELRLTSLTGTVLDWQVGVYYNDERSTGTTIASDLAQPGGRFFGLPLYNGSVPTKYKEYAVFGDVTLHFTTKADVTLGVRDSRDDQNYTQTVQGLFSSPSDPLAFISRSVKSSENVRTYLVNPRYHLTDDEMLYARFATGYRPGGPNLVAFDAAGHPLGNPTFEPDTVYTYEVGLKSAFPQHKASLDFDVYYIDWRNIQLVGQVNGLEQLENGGKAGVFGSEMTGSYQIGALTVGGSLAYIDAKLKEDAIDLDAKDGQRLPLSARISAAITADYRYPIMGTLSGDVGISDRFVGARTQGFDNSTVEPQYILGSYNLFDLRAGVDLPNVTVSLYAKNVFNKLGFISAGLSASDPTLPALVTLTQPRTVGLEIKAHFKQ
jgi:iron complex outermembrane receptor protein